MSSEHGYRGRACLLCSSLTIKWQDDILFLRYNVRINELASITPLNAHANKVFDELKVVMKDITYVRNSVVHSIVLEDDNEGHVFHLRSKTRSLTKAEVFSAEEITNYADHTLNGCTGLIRFCTISVTAHDCITRCAGTLHTVQLGNAAQLKWRPPRGQSCPCGGVHERHHRGPPASGATA